MLSLLNTIVVITWQGIFEFIFSLDEVMALQLHVLDVFVHNVALTFDGDILASLSLVIVANVVVASHVEILVHFLACVRVVPILRLDFLRDIVIIAHIYL